MVLAKPRVRKHKERARLERAAQDPAPPPEQGPLAGVHGKKRKRLAKYIVCVVL